MADTKITGLTELTSTLLSYILPVVEDPAGTPITKKITIANALQTLYITVRNVSGSTLTYGQTVYINGYNAGQDLPTVALADADGVNTFPAVGCVVESGGLGNNANGSVLVHGKLKGDSTDNLNTSGFAVGAGVYVSTTPGGFSAKPTAATAEVQKLGIVLRSHGTLGVVEVVGAGRTNDIPNKQTTDVFRIADNTDDTKLVDWDATAIASGTTRTITMPDKDVSLDSASATAEGLVELATSAEIDTGTDTTRAVTAEGIKSSKNVPSVIPGTSGNVLTSDGTDWTSAAAGGGGGTLVGTGTATVDVRNSTAETNLVSESIPADTLGTAGAIHARIFISDIDSDGGTLILRVKYGGTTLITTASLTPQVDQNGYIDVYLIGAGTTGSQEANFIIFVHKLSTSTSASHHTLMSVGNGTASEDSTGALTFAITAQWNTATAGSGITTSGYVVEKIVA